VSCGSCEERLLVKVDDDNDTTQRTIYEQDTSSPTDNEDDSYLIASEIRAGIVAKY
jgi:hypothetical protein